MYIYMYIHHEHIGMGLMPTTVFVSFNFSFCFHLRNGLFRNMELIGLCAWAFVCPVIFALFARRKTNQSGGC